jgi:hypothetical protein
MRRPGQTHERTVGLLSAALDGELTGLQQHELRQHLAACGRCRQVQRDLHAQRELLRGLPPAVPPRDLWARTSVALDREVARRRLVGRPAVSRGPLLTTTVVLAVSLLLVSAELDLSRRPSPTDSPGGVLPTPFSVAGQPLAFLATSAEGIVLYRKQVDRVCPGNALGCIVEDTGQQVFIAVPPDTLPQSLSVSPDGEHIAITGRGQDREAVFALTFSPDTSPPPTAAPTVTPPEDIGPGRSTADPQSTAETTPSAPAVAPTAAPSLATVTILEDVLTVGAPPAWSADGSTLAFSALPADGSHGPDVYLWQAGDERARRLTSDRSSYFASWAGNRIVISRVEQSIDEDGQGRILTVVHDMATAEERTVDVADLWLPAVSPTGDAVATWQGVLAVDGTRATPLRGALYVTRWQSLDPFTAGDEPEPSEPPPADELPDASEPAESPAGDDEQTTASPEPMLTLPPAAVDGETSEPSAGPDVEESAGPTAPPGEDLTPAPAVELTPIDLDGLEGQVVDWQIRWSGDGTAIAVWLADAPGSSWGELRVLGYDPAAGVVAAQPLVKSMLAGRRFTLGRDRLAWITSVDGSLDGEVRVTTWGADGEGGLRIPSSDLREVVPGF